MPILDALWEAAQCTPHRLGIYFTTAVGDPGDDGDDIPMVWHSKLMVVDDRLLTVGSCNTSNRSMGLDTELNVTWEVESGSEDKAMQAIRLARVSLLAEHCGLPEDTLELERRHGLVEYLDGLANSRAGRLRPLTREAMFEDRNWLKQLERLGLSFDPTRSTDEDVYESFTPNSESLLDRGIRRLKERLPGKDKRPSG